jgi:RNA polymerase sigma factor (sigma-70 family)
VRTRKDGAVLRQIDALFNLGVIRDLTDGQLLERFSTGNGEAAELAFAALVERHGAMVMRVCRALLKDPHDTHDAFQATFLILVKKARGLWVRDSLGPWLYRVAFRTASCARAASARRRRHEQRRTELASTVDRSQDHSVSERTRVLHEEIDRLPERYRVPIVLCDLEGHTCEEAARRMGRPVGTVKCWRSRGRERLRNRLTRLGLAPAVGVVFTMDGARAAVPKATAEATVRFAIRVVTESTTAGAVSASVRSLVKGVLKTMYMTKLRTGAATILALAAIAAGVAVTARVVADGPKDEAARHALDRESPPKLVALEPSLERGELTLHTAIVYGLDNFQGIQTLRVSDREDRGAGYVIAPVSQDMEAPRFKAEVMALLRSIEEQYWNLAEQHAQLASAEKAVVFAKDALIKGQADAKEGDDTNAVKEARQRIEEFQLAVVTKNSDIITSERQLRDILGLPSSDGRRLVPVTAPTEAHFEPDWDKCLAEMTANHLDILQAKARVAKANGGTELVVQSESLKTVVHQKTHDLARFFLEVEANYKQFLAASRKRAEVAQSDEAQWTYYEDGRITLGRYLDAVKRRADAIAQEANVKARYNSSICKLEEAKGTLLEYDKIKVVPCPPPAPVVESKKRAHSVSLAPAPTAPIQPTASPQPLHPQTSGAETARIPDGSGGGKTYSFHFTLGGGAKPVEIQGSFTVSPALTRH